MKTKLIYFIMGIWAWLTPLFPFFILSGICIAIDTYFGFKLAKKRGRANSRRFSRVIYKLFLYNVIIVSAYILDLYVLGGFVGNFTTVDLATTKAIVFGVLVVELISVDEKLRALNGKGFQFYFDRVMKIIKNLNEKRKEL